MLTLLGLVLLFQELGLIRYGWNVLWPLFLIGAGLFLLAQSTRRRMPVTTQTLSVPLGTAERALVRLHHGAGKLHVDTGAPAEQLLSGTFGGGVDLQTERDGSMITVNLQLPRDAFLAGFPWWGSATLDWSVRLSPEVDLALDIGNGADGTYLDLSALRVTNLTLRTGASSTTVRLPASAGYTRARFEAGAASISLRVPEGVAARMRIHSGLAEIAVDTSRFARVGSEEYRSPDYDTATNKVDIDIQTGLASVHVR